MKGKDCLAQPWERDKILVVHEKTQKTKKNGTFVHTLSGRTGRDRKGKNKERIISKIEGMVLY
jgi:hypothetical protein